MQVVLYGVLLIYALPLLIVGYATFGSDLFRLQSAFIPISAAISNAYVTAARESFGSIIVPLVAAYSIQIRSADEELPAKTFWLLIVLMAVALVSISLYGIVSGYESRLTEDNANAGDILKRVTLEYFRDGLTYIALTLGITFNPREERLARGGGQ